MSRIIVSTNVFKLYDSETELMSAVAVRLLYYFRFASASPTLYLIILDPMGHTQPPTAICFQL